MKRILTAFILSFTSLLLTGCTSGEEKKAAVQDLNNPSTEIVRQETREAPVVKRTLSPHASIGDTPAQFKKEYEKNYGDEEIALYQKDFLIVYFENQRAANVQFQFGNHPDGEMDKGEITQYVVERLPRDSAKIKEVDEGNSHQHVTQYYSHSLEEATSKESFRGDEPGMFTVTVYDGEIGGTTVAISLGEAK